MTQKSLRHVFLTVLATTLFLSACDQAEQGRVLNYEKGTYLGQRDQGLSDQGNNALRQRTLMQGT